MHVAKFIAGLKLPPEVQKILVEDDINGSSLIKMKVTDFRDIGITKAGHLVTLRDAVNKLKKLNHTQVEEKFRKKNMDKSLPLEWSRKVAENHYSVVGDTLIEEESSMYTSSTARNGEASKKRGMSDSDNPTVKKTGNKKQRNSKNWSKDESYKKPKKNSMSISHSSLSVNSEDNIVNKKKKRSTDSADDAMENLSKFRKIANGKSYMEDDQEALTTHAKRLSRGFTSDSNKSTSEIVKLKMDSGKLSTGMGDSFITRQKSTLTARKADTESSSSTESSEEGNEVRERVKAKRNNRVKKVKREPPALKRDLSGSGDGYYQIDRSEIKIEGKVQEGAFGEVFKGVWLGNDVAIKKFRKRNKNITKQNLEAEVEILKNLRHPNILLYMGVCISDNDYLMITEFMENGSLFDHIHLKKTKIGPSLFVDMIEDIVLGMFYLHGRKVLHCDLKSSNILVDSNWNIKLADFGLSRIYKTTKQHRRARIGTPNWMAPEVIKGEKYTDASDVYSFGMCLWEMIAHKVPYQGLTFPQITGLVGYNPNHRVETPPDCHPVFKKMIEDCTQYDPKLRPSFKDIMGDLKKSKKELQKQAFIIKELEAFFGKYEERGTDGVWEKKVR